MKSALYAVVGLVGLSVGMTRARGDMVVNVNADASRLVGGLSWTFNGQAVTNALAGTLLVSTGGGAAADAYCIDLYHDIYVGNNTYSVTASPIAGFTQAGKGGGAVGGDGPGLGYLFSTFDHVIAGETGTQRVIDGAGLQVALWKMVYDGSAATTSSPINLSGGSFRFLDSSTATSNQHLVYAAASRYLTGYNGSQTGSAELLKVTDHGPNDALYQDLVTGTNAPVVSAAAAVPEPSTLALMGIGVVGLAISRRRNRTGESEAIGS